MAGAIDEQLPDGCCSSGEDLFISKRDPNAPLMRVQNEAGEMLIELDYKGGGKFGEGYTPEEALRAFWEGISGQTGLAAIKEVCAAHGYRVVEAEETP